MIKGYKYIYFYMKMSYSLLCRYSINKIEVKLDLPNYAAKSNLKTQQVGYITIY